MDRRAFLRPRPAPADTIDAPRVPTLGVLPKAQVEALHALAFRPSDALPTAGGLAPFAGAWTERRARHLLRRATFGPTPEAVAGAAALGAGPAADALVDGALSAPLPPTPTWVPRRPPPSSAPQSEKDAFVALNGEWRRETRDGVVAEALGLRAAGTALRERLALVWHDHFVTEYRTHNSATWLWRYWALLRAHALGDFKALVHEMGTTPAMLRYLDGHRNRRGTARDRYGRLNENYARELLELFTMGITGPDGAPNYTDVREAGDASDVRQLALVLTGWELRREESTDVVFTPDRYDDGEKTVFGETGAFGYDDVVPLLWRHRADAIAHFVCQTIYRAFVYEVPNETVVGQMADAFRDADFQIAPVVRALLKSRHFHSDATVGARIKGPLELYLGAFSELGLDAAAAPYFLVNEAGKANQELFNPPDVFGWPGYRAWLDTSSLPQRWTSLDALAHRQRGERPMSALVQRMPSPDVRRPGPGAARALAADLARHLLPQPPTDAQTDAYVEVLLAGSEEYAWDPAIGEAEGRVRGLVAHLVSLPEYQLV